MKTVEDQLSAYGQFIDERLDSEPVRGRSGGRARGERVDRRMLLAAAAVVVTAVAVGSLVVSRDEGGTDVAANGGSPLVLLPPEDGDGRIWDAFRRPYESPTSPHAVFGSDLDPRSLVFVSASVPAGSVRVGLEDAEAVEINGSTGTLGRGAGGSTVLEWDTTDATFVLSAGDLVDRETVIRIAEGADLDQGSVAASWLPTGWHQIWASSSGAGSTTETSYRVISDAATFTVTLWTGAPTAAEIGIHFPAGGERVTVRGVSGYLSGSIDNLFLSWREAPDTVVLVQQSTDTGLGAAGIVAFAETLRAADDEWATFQDNARRTGSVAVVTTSTTAPHQAVEVDYERLEYEQEASLTCPGESPREASGSAVFEVWGDRDAKQWRNLVTYPDGSTRELVVHGSPWYPTSGGSRGEAGLETAGCGGDIGTVVAEPGQGSLVALNPRAEIPLMPDGTSAVLRYDDYAEAVPGDHVDSLGRTAVLWRSIIEGSASGSFGERPLTQIEEWYVDESTGDVLERTFEQHLEGISVARWRLTATDTGQRRVPADTFSHEGLDPIEIFAPPWERSNATPTTEG